MSKKKGGNIVLDVRTGLILLLLANIVAFTSQNAFVIHVLVGTLLILVTLCGCVRLALKFLVFYSVILCLQYVIFPIAPKIISTSFSIIVLYSQKMMPCIIIATFIVKRVTMRHVVVALRKWHVPQTLIIPLSVTMRYFPALKEETLHIHDAMKLRNIPIMQRIEALIVPLMMSATNTAEELSAAAVTRGVENPTKKTSVITLRMSIVDYAVIGFYVVFAILAILEVFG